MVTYIRVVMLTMQFVNNLYNHVSGGTLSDTRTNLDSIKSLIYSNAKATVTLDSTALKELVKLSTSGSSKPTRGVSFSVYVRATALTVGKGQTIKYDEIMTNDGNGYDDRTGVFVCPVTGTYMFVVDTLCQADTWLAIKVNRTYVANVHMRLHNSSIWGQISRTVIVKLNRGDHVKVDNVGQSTAISHGGYSGFTGTLLY
ncbi:complement C1q-like protein 2 [Saccostrea echinata]|uniref:complement C1q-like protein 2 n=1 Tax=Saccostrea echinata TaxID=191078 RepID=UPI002A7FE96A|nr:complement C1q-like protein 2 [Saccostrea echinata]